MRLACAKIRGLFPQSLMRQSCQQHAKLRNQELASKMSVDVALTSRRK